MRIKIIISALLWALFTCSPVSAENKVIPLESAVTCITASCHAEMGKRKYVHATGIDSKYCTRCHTLIKFGEHRFEKIPQDTGSLCMQCHSKESTVSKSIKGSPSKVMFNDPEMKLHTPFAEGKCTECHDAHESNFYKHLKSNYPAEVYTSYSAETYSLCLKCHKEFERALTEPRTFSDTLFRNGNLNLHFRHINRSKSRGCSTCHHHHGSKNPKLIRENILFGTVMIPIQFKKIDTGGSCSPPCHVTINYDRYDPYPVPLRTSPRPGIDATDEELKLSRERDLQLKLQKDKKE